MARVASGCLSDLETHDRDAVVKAKIKTYPTQFEVINKNGVSVIVRSKKCEL